MEKTSLEFSRWVISFGFTQTFLIEGAWFHAFANGRWGIVFKRLERFYTFSVDTHVAIVKTRLIYSHPLPNQSFPKPHCLDPRTPNANTKPNADILRAPLGVWSSSFLWTNLHKRIDKLPLQSHHTLVSRSPFIFATAFFASRSPSVFEGNDWCAILHYSNRAAPLTKKPPVCVFFCLCMFSQYENSLAPLACNLREQIKGPVIALQSNRCE